jgi:hypothetical protein
MVPIEDNDEEGWHNKTITKILNICTDGCTQPKTIGANTSITRSAKKNHSRDSR